MPNGFEYCASLLLTASTMSGWPLGIVFIDLISSHHSVKRAILSELLQVEGVEWVALSTSEGFMEEIVGGSPKYVEGEASLLPSLIGRGESLMEELSIEGVDSATILATGGVITARVVDDSHFLILKLETGANLGLVRAMMVDCTERLNRLG